MSRLAHARLLAESFLRQHPDGRLIALVVDDVDGAVRDEEFEVVRPEDLALESAEFVRLAAMYDPLALACALKPWLLSFVLDSGADPIVYLDTDIEVFAPLVRLVELAREHSIVLTTHIPEPSPRFDNSEWAASLCGVFNGGCLAVSSAAHPFLDWWADRVSRHCVRLTDLGFFHDQRWLDFVPTYFDHVVLRRRAYNFGFGSPPSRLVRDESGRYVVDGELLHCFHYGGLFDPELPWRPHPQVDLHDRSSLLAEISHGYSARLIDRGYREYVRMPYAFDLDEPVREAYRVALLQHEFDGEPEPPNPLQPGGVEELAAFLNRPRPLPEPKARRVVWEGPHALRFGMAIANRELCAALAEHVELEAIESGAPSRFAEVHVRHEWPPRFDAPDAARWVVMQPWEYGSPPRAWIDPLNELVDELWVPTSYVRDCFVAGGVDPAKVVVVPLGVDTARFRPGLEPLPLPTRKTFRFLFVGGTIFRKGADVLLDTYLQTFGPDDDVCLVVNDLGADTFYAGQSLRERIQQAQVDPAAAEILYYGADFDDTELPRLYASCDALVHPYRGEGFALPVAEAMACGLHVIVTGLGACLDYCTPANASFVPAHRVDLPPLVGDLETTASVWFGEPDRAALSKAMRKAVADPKRGRELGRRASEDIARDWTWTRSAAAAAERISVLASRRRELSVCMIVRDEEQLLPRALESVRDVADELIVVDTGSSDSTVEIARSFGAQVQFQPWNDDFAAARNESLRHATKDWILVLDGDQELDAGSHAELRRLTAACAPRAYLLRQLNSVQSGSTEELYEHLTLRLFRNHAAVHFEGRVHEQLVCVRPELRFEIHSSGVVLHHHGYRPEFVDPVTLERDRAALEEAVLESPQEPFHAFNLGMTYRALGRAEDAELELLRAIALCAPSFAQGIYPHYVVSAYLAVAQSLLERGRAGDAAAACEAALVLRPDFPDVQVTLGAALTELGRLDEAHAAYERAVGSSSVRAFTLTDRAAGGWRALLGLADVLARLGRLEEAEARLEQATAAAPANPVVLAARERLAAASRARR